MGLSLHKISKKTGIHVSTLSREIRRNSGERGYRYQQADNKAVSRRSQASQMPKKLNESMSKEIRLRLMVDWSPEQISGRLTLENKPISHETIYRYVWQDKRMGGELYRHLRHHGKRYNKRSSGKAGRGCISNRIDIAERPAIVEEKSRIGDWEGDTLSGVRHKAEAILSYVDRCSKLTILQKLGRKTADQVRRKTVKRLSKLPHPVHTITYDNGKEFADHEEIAKALDAACYFATPYHSWERGLNEHTNGLVRQYIPKSSDLSAVSDEEIQAIENRLNHRPRKVLNYRTPFEIFFAKPKKKLGVALRC